MAEIPQASTPKPTKKKAAKAGTKKRQRRDSLAVVCEKMAKLSFGELTRLPAALVEADADVARYLLQRLRDELNAPEV